ATGRSGFWLCWGGVGPWDCGSRTRLPLALICSVFSGVRRITQPGWPRHSTVICCPGSSLLIFTRTGAPADFALALGFQEATKGTAAPTTPTPPTTEVAPTRKRRRL